jgi:hypothetical protein
MAVAFRHKEAIIEPTDQQVGAVFQKVTLRKFVCKNPTSGFARTHSYMEIAAVAGCVGVSPAWWGHYGATLNFDDIGFVDRDGYTHYLAGSVGEAAYDKSTQLYSRTCDIPIYDGRIYINHRWESGYGDDDWDQGGTLKMTIHISGGGWLYDEQGQLVRDSKGNAKRAGFIGMLPFTAKIKAK